MKARALLLLGAALPALGLVSCAATDGLSVIYERDVGGLPVRAAYGDGKASVSVAWPWIDKLKPTGQK